MVTPKDRRELFLAYSRSVFGEGPILDYLDQYLLPAADTEVKGLFETAKVYRIYSTDQLQFLIDQPEVLRFYMSLMLLEDLKISLCPISKAHLKTLEDLELITFKNGEITPSIQVMKLPRFEDSNPRAVTKASEFIMKNVDLFLAKEGHRNQELSFTIQMVSPEDADLILDRTRSLKRWIQSLGKRDVKPTHVPIISVGFCKALEPKDLK